LTRKLQEKRDSYKLMSYLANIPILFFHREESLCPDCQARLLVQKVGVSRMIYTISYGAIEIRE